MNKLLTAGIIIFLAIVENEILTWLALLVGACIGIKKLFSMGIAEYEQQHSENQN